MSKNFMLFPTVMMNKLSIELLQNRELEALARNIRYGISDYADLCEDTEKSFDEEIYDE